MPLISRSNPERRELEAASVVSGLVLEGAPGSAPDGPSLAEQYLIVTGRQPDRGVLETVVGVDDRTRILETERSPWRMICALTIRGANSAPFVGTAWFAGPRTLITAGHCVYHPNDLGGWARSIQISPGRNADIRPFGTVTAQRFSSVVPWIDSQEADYDVGCIHLDEDLGAQTGWFGISVLPGADLIGLRVNISGYPLALGNGTQQWFNSNAVERVTSRRLFYTVDTSGGQSGAPVWTQDEGTDKTPRAVAIHAYGVGDTLPEANSAPMIDADVFETIRGWVDSGPS